MAVRLIVRAEHTGLQARAEVKSHITRIKITALLNALVVEKQAPHVHGANTGTIHAIPVGDSVISQMHASLNLRRSTWLKSQRHHNPTPLQFHFLSAFSINAENNGIKVPIEVNGIHLLIMKLDTGAGVSVILQETYNRHFKETPPQPSDAHLHTYTRHTVQVSGQFLVQLKYQNQNVTVPLLGRNWLSCVKLDWKKIHSIHASDQGLTPDVKSQLHTTV